MTVTNKKGATPKATPTSTAQPTDTPVPTKTPRPTRKPSKPAPTPVEIAYIADYEIELGEKLDVKAKVTPAEGTIEDYNISTTNEYVATVDERGVIQSNHIGKCLLVLTSNTDETKKESYKLCVTDDFVAPDGFNVYYTTRTLLMGK